MNKIKIIQYTDLEEVDIFNSLITSKTIYIWYATNPFARIYLITLIMLR